MFKMGDQPAEDWDAEDDGGALEISEDVQIEDNAMHKDVEGASDQMKTRRTNDDVRRAIEGLKDIPDEELQEFLDEEDFMEGLDVVDAWEGEEKKEYKSNQHRNRPRDREHRRNSRDRHRRDYRSTYIRDKPRRDDKKREEIRRDPSKSTKDIEKDKIRVKKDSESKMLAEKEKAIKCLLDSDNVVPPGTEVEAIQTIVELGQKATPRIRRSREHRRSFKPSPVRRRSNDRVRLSPHRRRSPFILSPERRRSPVRLSSERRRSLLKSDNRRSPGMLSPERRRSPFRLSPERPRRPSWERRLSAEKWGMERQRRRIETHERDPKFLGRRSRSHDRYRSRSIERHRRRFSRSPVNRRFSPRRRSRSRSRSPDRRARKRSPFINEIARQFRNEGMMPSAPMNSGFMGQPPMGGVPPLMGMPMYEQESGPPPQPPPYMHQPGQPGPPGMQMPGGPQPPFMNFEPHQPPVLMMNFEPLSLQPLAPPQIDYSSGPVMYNQPNPGPVPPANPAQLLPLPVPSPQPVPAPGPNDQMPPMFNQMHCMPLSQSSANQPPSDSVNRRSPTPHSYKGRRSTTPYNGLQTSSHKDRLKTPEPPVISDSKLFEKTSLSSLLEASVSAKDSIGVPVLYPGFKPEILQHCENALSDLPIEDPRLKMKGRFFFDPKKEEPRDAHDERTSNSILLRRGKSKIYWTEEEEQQLPNVKPRVQMHQKICQTDEVEVDTKFTQTNVSTADFSAQVYDCEFQQTTKEEKRPIMDRLDWNMRETFDYAPKIREADDLRWSLSNSSQKRTWTRTMSPSRGHDDRGSIGDSSMDRGSRNMESPIRGRDSYSSHRSSDRDHFMRENYTSSYRRNIEEHEDYRDNRSEHSRGESPMVLEDSEEELEVEQNDFSRGSSDWHGRGKPMRGKSIPLYKMHSVPRGKHLPSRPYRGGRGNFRGKF